jgi:LysM repeat protein
MPIKSLYKVLLISLFILAITGVLEAQVTVTRSENRVILEGKIFYLHPVKPGQTLYSICAAYNVPETLVVKENPGSDLNLQVGQVLKIPANVQKESVAPVVPPVFAPADTLPGKHEVKKGETMFSIAKFYNVTLSDLDMANPGVVNHEISVGQYLNIPGNKPAGNMVQPEHISEKPAEVTGNDEVFEEKRDSIQGDFIYHRVRRRETVYGICRMYGITEDVLKNYNPELATGGLKNGQNLKIPVIPEAGKTAETHPSKTNDTIGVYTEQPYDTISISNNYSYFLDSMPAVSDRDFNVAYLIPFNFRENDTIAPVKRDVRARDENINSDVTEDPNDQMLSSRNFIEFLEGSLLAVDSLKNEGMSVNVFVYDTRRNTDRINEILSSDEFRKMNLIIGPFYSFEVELVSQYAKARHIPLVSPLSAELGPVQSNPLLLQMNPGYKTEFEQLSEYIAGFSDQNIIFIRGTDSLEIPRIRFLKDQLKEKLGSFNLPDSMVFREVVYEIASRANLSADIQKVLSNDKPNLVVVPETDEALVSTVVTQLFFQLKNCEINLVGLPHWNTFQNIDFSYFHKLNLTYLTPYYFTYDSPYIKHFLRDYRNTFYAEPVTLTKKGGSYAILGYDISYHFLKSIGMHGRRFLLHLNDDNGLELMNNFRFYPVGNGGGFENRSLVLVKFHPDLSISSEPVPGGR